MSQPLDHARDVSSASEQYAVAAEAAQRWVEGAASGDWTAFKRMLAEDVRFSVPAPGLAPTGVGLAEAEGFFSFLAENVRTTLVVKNVLADGGTVGFEIRAEGLLQGRRMANHLFLVLVVQGGVVTSFREYVAWPPGGLDDTAAGRDLLD
ncbi:nuclear transport factor 2 family protein [Streptomyces sp. NPDC006645]|uniref:nuclear transport factor 2 family protein n=1 Tax=unclassified Streptomyces TaxID=2593676 RepID=UPI0033A9D6EB